MSWLQDAVLALINGATSLLSGISGMGGGTILIGVMPLFLPAAAIVPVHGATQLASNASRAWFGRHDLRYDDLWPYVAGALAGAAAFGFLVRWVSLDWVPVLIAVYILLTQWSKTVNHWLKNRENFYIIGFLQVGIGMFVGSPGPLQMPLLLKKYPDVHTAVTTGSLMVSVFHVLKIVGYVWLGFSFRDYWPLVLLLTVSAVVGSYVGTRLRHRISVVWIRRMVPWLLTILAVKILVVSAKEHGLLAGILGLSL